MVLKEAGKAFVHRHPGPSISSQRKQSWPDNEGYLHAKIDKHQIDIEFNQSFTKECRGAQRLIGFSQNPCHQYAVLMTGR